MVASISEVRSAGKLDNGQERFAFDVVLEDGTGHDEIMQVSFTIFGSSQDQSHQQLSSWHKQSQPISFYGINGSRTDTEFSCVGLRSSHDFWFACAEPPKAVKIQTQDWKKDPSKTTRMFATKSWEPNEDYSNEQGIETSCQILAQMDGCQFDGVFQVNWCNVAVCGEVCTKDMKRLFPRVALTDFSGTVQCYMIEKAALALTEIDSKDEFVAKHDKNELYFPTLASVKVARKTSDGKALMMVVEACKTSPWLRHSKAGKSWQA